MKTAGIIAEYNPFHTGHKYQIDHVKGTLSADYVVIAMSGDFVQRGTPALLSKYVRAEMALRAGADLVLELPVSCATASAELFARSGVQLLDGLGVVDTLCFGSECGEHGDSYEAGRDSCGRARRIQKCSSTESERRNDVSQSQEPGPWGSFAGK